MGSLIGILSDTHVLVLMDDKRLCDKLVRLFSEMGAIVHSAVSQAEAIGVYWRLFRSGIRPRVVVTSWWLAKPDSNEFKFLQLLDRVEQDGTSIDLFRNILDLDDTAFLTVYTQDAEGAVKILKKWEIKAEVFNREVTDPAEFAAAVAMHSGVNNQRAKGRHTESIYRELAQRERVMGSGIHPAPNYGFG